MTQKPTEVTEFDSQQVANFQVIVDDLATNGMRIRYEGVVPTTSTLKENEALVYDDGAGTRRLYTITREGNLLVLADSSSGAAPTGAAGGVLGGTYPDPDFTTGAFNPIFAGLAFDGSSVNAEDTYIRAGQGTLSTGTLVIGSQPFTSASSYAVVPTRIRGTDISQGLQISAQSASSFTIRDSTDSNDTVNWIAIGT